MSEKFLVIGASSFYGSSFVECVRGHGQEAVPASLRGPMPSLAGYDYIVNFAAENIVAESWYRPTDFIDVNVRKTTQLFEALRSAKIRKYIHVSTPEVYGSTGDKWVSEEYKDWKPSTPYAVTRAASDMMLLAYQRAYDIHAVITRTCNIYGTGQPDNRIIPGSFAKIQRGEKIKLEGAGDSIRAFMHVSDACEATYLLCQQGNVGQSYHISSKSTIQIQALVREICRVAGTTYEEAVESVPDRRGKDYAYRLDSTKMRALGWRDRVRLNEGLKEFV